MDYINKEVRPEILAPVGKEDMLFAAVRAGADAVYLGFGSLNARAGAENFTEETLLSAIEYAHARGVKVYVTLNTIIFENEKQKLIEAINIISHAGADAIIVQDMGTAALIRQISPHMPIHASTQMSINTVSGAKMLKGLGFKRVVLARELSKEDIQEIVNSVDIETEVFVHGAHCMSVSGQCTMSAMIGGRSGNRGLCAQPCRLPFSENSEREEYNLSMKDLSLLRHMRELADIGVTSAKIEGRMKRPEYVASAVSAARLARSGSPDFEKEMERLSKIYSRDGFTDGFYKNKIDKNMFGKRQKADVLAAKEVLTEVANEFRAEKPLIPIKMKYIQQAGDAISLELSDRDGNIAYEIGAFPEAAINQGTDRERAFKNLSKLGGTHYYLENGADDITFDIDETQAVPVSAINALRRESIAQLDIKRSEGYEKATLPYEQISFDEILEKPAFPPPLAATPAPASLDRAKTPVLRARFRTDENIPFDELHAFSHIYLPVKLALKHEKNLSKIKDKIILEPPRVQFSKEKTITEDFRRAANLGFSQMVAMNLGDLYMAKELGLVVHGAYSLNIVNSSALKMYANLGLVDSEASLELDIRRAGDIKQIIPLGAVAYGYVPLMLTRNCPRKAKDGCENCSGTFKMTDRLNQDFTVSCNEYKTASEVFNCVPIFMADRLAELRKFDFLTLNFSFETLAEVRSVINEYQNPSGQTPRDFTRGIFYRAIA